MKLKIRLTDGELRVLDTFLQLTLMGRDMRQLREEPTDYLILANLYEMFLKVHAKSEDLRLFPRADRVTRLTISRAQALAIYCTVELPEPTDSLPWLSRDYALDVLNTLRGHIHQQFLV